MATLTSLPLAESDQEFLDKVIAGQSGRPGALLGILEKAQEHEPRKFLSRETLEYIAAKTDTPLARVYSVVTFYALFNLEPQGKNTICICRGTACHTRGSRDLLESLMFKLGFHNPDEESGGQDRAQYQRWQVHASHGGLLWPMRACSRGRGES